MELQRNLPSQVRKQVDEELNNLEDRYDNLISLYKKSTYAYKLEAISKLSWAKFSHGFFHKISILKIIKMTQKNNSLIFINKIKNLPIFMKKIQTFV